MTVPSLALCVVSALAGWSCAPIEPTADDVSGAASTTVRGAARDGLLPRLPNAAVSPSVGAASFVRRVSVYVVNSTSNTVTVYDAGASGELTRTHSIPVGATPYGITLNANATVAYVANAGSGDVTTYAVDNTGLLVARSSTPFAGASHVSLDPTGKWAFVTAFSPGDRVSSFQVDSMTGELMPTGSTISAMTAPFNSAVDPNGNFLVFATSRLPFRVYSARIDALAGTITQSAVVDTGTTPRGVGIHPSGRFVYATNIGGHQIVPHGFNPVTGALTPQAPVAIQYPRSMVFDSTGLHLYVTSYTADLTGSIVHFNVDPVLGTLTLADTTPTGGSQTFALQFAPSENFLYAVDVASHTIETFKVFPGSGSLSLIDTQATDEGPVALAVVERTVFIP
jgi:6-phosphogluconolactonase